MAVIAVTLYRLVPATVFKTVVPPERWEVSSILTRSR